VIGKASQAAQVSGIYRAAMSIGGNQHAGTLVYALFRSFEAAAKRSGSLETM
jgi:hypothetical protein